mmetsp:Transcript_117197/g.304139  ORF Transcript_117197/g.304139 Transcript_117197/m.304139 type:complete len:184 (+) Transcript_117197:67-618(+)
MGANVGCCSSSANPRLDDDTTSSNVLEDGISLAWDSKPLFQPRTSRARDGFEKMPISSGTTELERIDPWTTDIVPVQNDASFLGCGPSSASACASPPKSMAPEDYLADTPANGSIMLFTGGGAAWVDDEEQRVVTLAPEEDQELDRCPRTRKTRGANNIADAEGSAGTKIDSANARGGPSVPS